MKPLHSGSFSLSVGLSALACAMLTQPALARQTQDDEAAQSSAANQGQQNQQGQSDQAVVPEDAETTIVVTGSRIAPRAGFDTLQPAVVIGGDQIKKLGYTNLADALNNLPQFGVPGNSAVGGQSGFGAGQNFIDFFGLGTQRTLTLVNGRRFVSSNTSSIFGPVNPGSQVDFNVIPESLVDRTETIAIGGAPIYGADAIAGTVNIILKKNFKGVELDAQNGISQRGDSAEHRVNAIIGKSFDNDRGNITLAGEWVKNAGLTTAQRRLTSGEGPFFTTAADPNAPYSEQLYYQHRYNIFTQYGTPLVADSIPEFAGVFNADGQVLTFSRDGRLIPLDFGTRTGSLIESAGGNGFDISDYGNLRTSDERYVATALAHYEFSKSLNFFGEAWYAHSKATNLLDQPYYSTALFGDAGTPNGNLVVNLNNPFLDPADRATIAANLDFNGDGVPDSDSFLLTRANTDLQPGNAGSTVELYRFVGGFDGDFTVIGKSWHYEASLNYGHSETTSSAPNLVFQNLQNALNATTDASGNIICTPGYSSAPIETIGSTCAPLDIFGQSDSAMQRAAIDYVTAIAHSRSIDTQFVGDVNMQGGLFALPGGDAKFSLGYEYRRETTSFDPGKFYYGETLPDGTRQGFGNSIPIDPISGNFHTNEVFGELNLPLVSPQTGSGFLEKLEFDGAVRHVDHSLAGGAWTYTAGGELGFAFLPGLTFRGNYTRSIRSPAITEAFNPTSQAFETGEDPCDARYIGNGPNPSTRAANCAAAGITQPFTSNYSDFTVPTTVSGNRNLRNEVAKSYTFGAVVRPSLVKGLTLSADYVSISLQDAIVSLGGDDILNACYDATDYPNSFCGLVTRDTAGQITLIKEGYYNAAVQNLRAVTAELDYQLPLERLGMGEAAGSLDFDINYYHVIKQYSRVGTGDIDHSAGEIGNPKNSFLANLTYVNPNGLQFLWQTQYFGPSVFDKDAPPTTYQYPGVKHWYLFNASLGYSIAPHYDIRFIVDNVFDTAPPFPAPAGGGTITYYPGILGRYMRVAVGVKF